jgi:hypothetical protein
VWYAATKFAGACAWLGIPPGWTAALSAWCFASSLILWLVLTKWILGAFDFARHRARIVPLRMSERGEHQHVPEPKTDFAEYLLSYQRLGVSRRWDVTVFRHASPRLTSKMNDRGGDDGYLSWVRETQTSFEASLLVKAALVSLLTLNVFWPVYFLFAAGCLSRAAWDDHQWFFLIGQNRYYDALEDFKVAEKQRQALEASEREEDQRRFIVKVLPSEDRGVSLAEAHERLPEELGSIMTIPHTQTPNSASS